MIALIRPWWNDRSARERVLLAIMLVLLAALLAWLGVARPIAAARAGAQADAAVATARHARAQALVAAIGARPAASAVPVADMVSRRLAEAGLNPSRLDAQGPGQVSLEIAAVNGRLLLGWAAALESRDGLVIDRLDAARNPDQSVHATLIVRRAQ